MFQLLQRSHAATLMEFRDVLSARGLISCELTLENKKAVGRCALPYYMRLLNVGLTPREAAQLLQDIAEGKDK